MIDNILEKNLAEVMEVATETGEKIITIECPCCHKTYYVLESEANYSNPSPAEDSPLALKRLGRKCPFCGLGSFFGNNNSRERQLEKMQVEIEAEKKAQEIYDKTRTPWKDICNMDLDFKDK